MNTIKISDISLRISDQAFSSSLSFKEKLEIAKLLEKLDVDVIETGYVTEDAADAVLMRTLASTIKKAVISAPVDPDTASVQRTFDAMQ
ncbi:MAG: 2-isopropylmalate synthase, partial [Clostridia bacterium]|nr:2-isopropylmalate synthase [Clostridia bacterium]